MVAVLLVLMALFVLCAPFLLTVRNADRASAETADRSSLRVALDSAARHARAGLGGSHPALDETPYFDDGAELAVSNRFQDGFLDVRDPEGVLWDLAVEDVAARVDLGSASPHVIGNLIGAVTRTTALVTREAAELAVGSTEGFLPEGVLWIDGELIAYEEREASAFAKLGRGLLAKGAPDEPAGCGPAPASAHALGVHVVDQRAWAVAEWRLATGEFRLYDGIEAVRGAADFAIAGELGREAYLALERTTSAHGGVRAGARWQRPVRVLGAIAGEPPQGCEIPVDDARWFNAGTTVRITDGRQTEYGLVRAAGREVLVLTRPLEQRFEPEDTVVQALARAPVNVNTARPEVLRALWLNLKLRDKSARITAQEVDQLVDVVLASRPFTGFEDFLRRVVLPAGGLDELPADAPVRPEVLAELGRGKKLDADGKPVLQGFLDREDALAIYKNALNANDGELEFATMPLAFTSRDVYGLSLRASVNAQNGSERAAGLRELTELIVPQQDLLSVWTRQEDFDLAPRLDLAAAGWLTGPVPTSRYDPLYGEVSSMRWPARARAHLGPHDTAPSIDPLAETTLVYSFASREEDGWAQLAPLRENDRERRANYALHFDDESKTLEGRYLPDGPVPLSLGSLGWSGGGGLMGGLSFSLWVQPRALEEGALLLDAGGNYTDSDRLSLLFEGGDLVLRVLDGAGDHPASTFVERAEVRYPLAGAGPGLPLDTWSHVTAAVDGTRPDQMALWVDGRRSKKTPGLTRLTAAIDPEAHDLPVESTEGFPDRCVLRIGDELIEVMKDGEKSFEARFQAVGETAGFGGRLAREYFQGAEGQEVNLGLFKTPGQYPAGTTVALYGYSLPLFSNASNGGGRLPAALGAFSVARVVGIDKGGVQTENQMELIQATLSSGNPLPLGYGLDSRGNDVTALVLAPADAGTTAEEVMQAFDPNGGYAALLSVSWKWTVTEQLGGTTIVEKDEYGVRLGGVEVIRYRGVSGTRLLIADRGDQVVLQNLQGSGVDSRVAGRGAYVFYFQSGVLVDGNGNDVLEPHNDELRAQVMVIPISLPVGTTGGITGFAPAQAGQSEFAQITRLGGDSHLNEWVRYDEITSDGHLVRDDPNDLLIANEAAHAGALLIEESADKNPASGGAGGGGGGGGGMQLVAAAEPEPRTTRAPAQPQGPQGTSSSWYYGIGEAEDQDLLVTRAVRSQFQFRGVLGTYSHDHPANTTVLPVFKTVELDETSGQPGRFDHVMFLSDQTSEPAFPALVQHTHRPLEFTRYFWADGGALTATQGDAPDSEEQTRMERGVIYVALAEALSVPFSASRLATQQTPIDTRLLTRMALFPSGELPRNVQSAQLGGAVRGTGSVPSAVVDEALFFANGFGGVAGLPGQLVLGQRLEDGDSSFQIKHEVVRTTLGDLKSTGALGQLPEHGGLLRIGDEILCYDSYDATTDQFTLPPGGRGLLGTEPQFHEIGEGLSPLPALPAGVLGAGIGPDDADLPLLDIPPGFPRQGTLWLEGELAHYTRGAGGILSMPRGSTEPGERDANGPGLFRGRYGTERTGHGAGTPAILFPVRYWDRWSDLADAPEMSYYQLSCDQPDAFWRRVFFKVGASGFPGPELGVLQRTDESVPWDESPDESEALELFLQGRLDTEGNPIGVQTDRVEWRVFVRHQPGSFDPDQGLAHGWKTTPRLELLGVEYMGPGRTLARVDR